MQTRKKGWFGAKNQEEEAKRSAAIAARKERSRKQVLEEVERLIKDPRFLVLTFDHLNWINPYTGQIVPTPFEPEKQARDYLIQHQPWKTEQALLPLPKLKQIAWIHYLMRNMQSEHYLGIFKGDYWLNPFSGTWVSDVPLNDQGKPDGETVKYLSKVLNADPRAATLNMLRPAELDRLATGLPDENPVEKEEHIDVYDGIIEEDESLYLNVDNLKQDAGSESNVRLAAVVNEMEDISGRQPVISSGEDALLSILPDLPGVDLNQALVDGYGETCDFAHSVTLNTGQTVIFHGSVCLPEHASEAPIQELRLMMDKAAKTENSVSALLQNYESAYLSSIFLVPSH